MKSNVKIFIFILIFLTSITSVYGQASVTISPSEVNAGDNIQAGFNELKKEQKNVLDLSKKSNNNKKQNHIKNNLKK